MKTRITALLLALVMAVCCLTGCTSTRVRSYSEESSDASADKYAAALHAYRSGKKVMTINGSPVYWNEYAYFLCAIMANMEQYGMQITDWSAVYDESTGETYTDIMTKSVTNNIAWNHLIETKAAENDVAFDAAGEQYVQDTIDQTIQNVVGDGGTEAELNEKLQSYYMDLDLFKYFTRTQYLYNGLASKLFGENGANISDEDVQEYADANSYMTAKHILFKTTDSSGTALSDADKAAKKQQAEQVAAQLKAVTDPDKRVELFDQLMEQYNEDTGESSRIPADSTGSSQTEPIWTSVHAAAWPRTIRQARWNQFIPLIGSPIWTASKIPTSSGISGRTIIPVASSWVRTPVVTLKPLPANMAMSGATIWAIMV